MKRVSFLEGLGAIGGFCFAAGGFMIFVGGAGIAILVPFMAARFILQLTQVTLPTPVHAVVLCIAFCLLLCWAWTISGKRGARFFEKLSRQGIKWPIAFSISMLFFAIVCFASLTSTLSDAGQVRLQPPLEKADVSRIQDLYLWHFLDSIPGMKIPETLHWQVPFQYEDGLSGFLLLAFKLVVIIPVIGSFATWSNIAKGKRSESPAEESADADPGMRSRPA